jgi:hypothetical protein
MKKKVDFETPNILKLLGFDTSGKENGISFSLNFSSFKVLIRFELGQTLEFMHNLMTFDF